MSDNENNAPSKHTSSVSSKQTSSVPLKKETVRVTLKAADSPPAVPSATLPPTPPPAAVRPPSPPVPPSVASGPPTASPPVVGAPTTPRAPAPAPTIKLATSRAPIGAPTIALKTANAPLPGGSGSGSATVALPKATVALNPPTKPLSPVAAAGTSSATLATVEEDPEESGVNTFTNILAGVGLAAAIIVLSLQLKTANIWIGVEDAESPGDWSKLLE